MLYRGLRGLAEVAGPERSEVQILTGIPADALALAARHFRADLICLGKSRERRGRGRFGATTPQRVLARTNLPVLVVPEAARARPASVLSALSDQSDGQHVLDEASRLALAWDVRLDVLHAIEPEVQAFVRKSAHRTSVDSQPHDDGPRPAAADTLSDARLCGLARDWLAEQVAKLKRRPGRAIPVVRLGDAGEETIAHAVRSDTGLIVLGRYSRDDSTPGVHALGSTTRLTMWVAPCPVLVLGADATGVERDASHSRQRRHTSRRTTPALALTSVSARTNQRPVSGPGPHRGDAA
jgi:nucleotide-binding universal stress UspA family protein